MPFSSSLSIYSIVRTLLIGMAALHKENLEFRHAVKLVQSYAKAFLHDNSFETLAIGLLSKEACPAHLIAVLVTD